MSPFFDYCHYCWKKNAYIWSAFSLIFHLLIQVRHERISPCSVAFSQSHEPASRVVLSPLSHVGAVDSGDCGLFFYSPSFL